MTIVTIFLVILIIALAFGNLLLHYTKPNGNGFKKVSLPSEEQMMVESKLKAVNQLANMAHQRLNTVESFLKQTVVPNSSKTKAKTSKTPAAAKAELRELEEKVHKLDNFRANTEIEMRAIKEIAFAMKEKLKQAPQQVKAPQEAPRKVKMVKRKTNLKPMAA